MRARVDEQGVAAGPAASATSTRELSHTVGNTQSYAALDLLDTGVLVLGPSLEVVHANARWAVWTGSPVSGAFASLIAGDSQQVQDVLRAVIADGEARQVLLHLRTARADATVRVVTGLAHRIADGLVVEAHTADEDAAALQVVARRLAEVTDMAEVLGTLCELAARQCHGTGAAVLRLRADEGEVVAASGAALPAMGRCFELRGSLLEQVVERGVVINEPNFMQSGRPLMRSVPELSLGPVIVSPLRAHGEMLGVLAVARGTGAQSFGEAELQRLRLMADHAALAVQKSLLLQQAQSADRAKGRFLATMSHELRTPLTALAGYNELLADQVIGPMSDPQLDILERMRSVTAHLSAMIEELLAFSSLEEGRETVRPTEFLAEDLVRAALDVVEPQARHKHLELIVSLPAESVRMSSDIDKARQILVNLLGNAVKFTDRGSVGIRLRKSDRAVRLEVHDTGIGILPEELARLFRPFAQVDTGLTRRHGGTGLGLYISRRLATLLGGHIEVNSEEGRGSTFTVVLPEVWES